MFVTPPLFSHWVVSIWKYLGCTIVSGAKLSFSIISDLSNFYCSTNAILRSNLFQNELVHKNFLHFHRVPSLTYCADLKELANGDMHKLSVALNDSIWLTYSYIRWESTRSLREELRFPNIVEIFYWRKKSFVENIQRTNNKVARFLLRRSLEWGNDCFFLVLTVFSS